MAVYCYSATCFPQEWIIGIIAVLVAGPLLTFVIMSRRGKPQETGQPVEQRVVWLQPVDEAGSLQMGDLIAGVERTEDSLVFTHPSWIDEEGNPYHAIVPIEKELPGRALDADKNVVEQWIVTKLGDELEAISFSTLVNKLQKRFDTLVANPRKVGRFYVGWPFGQKGGLSSLIESTTGKLLAFGGVGLITFFIGFLIAAAEHVRFA